MRLLHACMHACAVPPSSANAWDHRRLQVVMEVPYQAALVIDYNKGANVPLGGRWPRLKEGLAKAQPLNWDLLMALAVIDGLAADGDTFWQVCSP